MHGWILTKPLRRIQVNLKIITKLINSDEAQLIIAINLKISIIKLPVG